MRACGAHDTADWLELNRVWRLDRGPKILNDEVDRLHAMRS
jgi:hypothetical protein